MDGVNICWFIDNLDQHHKVLLLLGGLCLPFDNVTDMLINRFIGVAVGFVLKGYQKSMAKEKVTLFNNTIIYSSSYQSFKELLDHLSAATSQQNNSYFHTLFI